MKKIGSYVVLIIGLVLSIIITLQNKNYTYQKKYLTFETLAKEISIKIQSRMDAYSGVLYAGSGFIHGSQEVSKEEWRDFANSLRLNEKFPGIQGFGFSKVVPNKINKTQEIYTQIVYLEPQNERNARAMGYDMFSEKIRREAMTRAIDFGSVSISGKVRLLQENGDDEQAGFLIYVPVFKKGLPLNTHQEKVEALYGFVYAPFRADDLFNGILEDNNKKYNLEIYDNVKNDKSLLYVDSKNHLVSDNIAIDIGLVLGGREWILSFKPYENFFDDETQNQPIMVFVIGLLITFVLFLLYASILKRDQLSQQLADKMTNKYFNEEARLNNIIKGTNLGTWEWNIKSGDTIFNQIWCQMLGYTLEELTPTSIDTWIELIHPDDKKRSEDEMSRHFSGESEFYECELRMKHKNGSSVWILDRGKIMSWDKDGKPLLMFGTHQAITDRKHLEEEIISERNFNSTIINSANTIIAVIDGEGRMIKLNKYGEEFTGYLEEEISSEPYFWCRLLPQNIQTNMIDMIKNLENTSIVKKTKNSWISRSGEERMFLWSNTLVKKDDKTIDYILTVGVNVTEQERQRELIEQKKEEFETIFKYSKDGIAILDLKGNFLDFNDEYLEMTGYTREELLQLTCLTLTAQEDKLKSEEIFKKVLKEGFVKSYEKSCHTKEGKTIVVNMSISLMPDHNRFLISSKNVTQNKMLESQAKLASMGEMIGNIAHQWRQPLNVINLIASGIALKHSRAKLNFDELVPMMENITTQADYLSKTIDDFKSYIKTSDMKSFVNLSQVLSKTLSITQPSLASHYIELVLDIDDTIEIEGFENALMQAFINILNNAKDALVENVDDDTKRYIFLTLKKINSNPTIIFKDNAGGIRSDIANRIFEPYFTTKHQDVGTGLGLSMAHKIITDRHHGELIVENERYIHQENSYTGAKFTIVFHETKM